MQSPVPAFAPTSTPELDALTTRQRQCLRLAALGLTSSGIGERLGLSPRTVDEHVMTACSVLGVRTRVQAVARMAVGDRRADEARSFRP
ncbi:LuxR C-terminal-related transcriptional regulator [Brevundimonas diminuta ATCC 11568]|jgi:DNA-binding NarL/FixJ family response regulator|uniref:helix-turn-helix domain-containing protein n=1 Tax=Brevundimonas TaxID=41275 RepID=UPI0025987DF2|nr:helix-turn-helix transcriptional regulator [uncultured Brevundimonas sp.]